MILRWLAHIFGPESIYPDMIRTETSASLPRRTLDNAVI